MEPGEAGIMKFSERNENLLFASFSSTLTNNKCLKTQNVFLTFELPHYPMPASGPSIKSIHLIESEPLTQNLQDCKCLCVSQWVLS